MAFTVANISMQRIAGSATFRFDPRYFLDDAVAEEAIIRSKAFFELGDFFPESMIKGVQPSYLDSPTDESVPVINTLSIQKLEINEDTCRHMLREDFEEVDEVRKLKKGDVLVTMDGGVSIGKPTLFELDKDFTVDSHICIMRPVGMSPRSLVYLLASPLGQRQFRRAESGARGQTAVTEEDIRRFVFPSALLPGLDKVASEIEKERRIIAEQRNILAEREKKSWKKLESLSA